MGSIHVHEFISLDGVIDAPAWTSGYDFLPEMERAIGAVTGRCRGILLGRTTYEMFESAWSKRTAEDDPGAPFFNDTTKYVVSGTLRRRRGRTRRSSVPTTIYATFGGKHDLYVKALDRYLLARDPSLVEVLSRPGPPPSTRFSDTAPSVEVLVGKIVAAEYVSVDGVMQDPAGTEGAEVGGWTNPYWNDELAKLQTDLLFASDALLLGRVTYEGFAHWGPWPDGFPGSRPCWRVQSAVTHV
jgi:dihydrofolate reductase